MCILIHGAADTLRRVLLDTRGLMASILSNNPDGLGLMYADDQGQPAHHKTLIARDLNAVPLATAWLETALPVDDRPVAFHARYTTHGDKDLDNCHPYAVDGGYLMHNGVLDIDTRSDSRRSDTWHYCREFLDDGAAHAILASERGRKLVSEHIGEDNKFVFLTKGGEIVIVNQGSGVEYEGLWFSNTYAWDVGLLDPVWGTRNRCHVNGDPRQDSRRNYWLGDNYDWRDGRYWREDPYDLDDPIDELRDRDGSLAHLVSMAPEDLTEVFLEHGASEVLGQLLSELGAPMVCRPQGDIDGETDPLDQLCRGLAHGCIPPEVHQLERAGHCDAIADAVIYGLDWLGHANTGPVSQALMAVR
ncbi:MAG: hypothetical protein LBF16_01275 [Pseudomonadales bacterium]|jgi:hypothetical protein|nr:hypothetical protein [Pseudomonadales bacterium]